MSNNGPPRKPCLLQRSKLTFALQASQVLVGSSQMMKNRQARSNPTRIDRIPSELQDTSNFDQKMNRSMTRSTGSDQTEKAVKSGNFQRPVG